MKTIPGIKPPPPPILTFFHVYACDETASTRGKTTAVIIAAKICNFAMAGNGSRVILDTGEWPVIYTASAEERNSVIQSFAVKVGQNALEVPKI